MTKEQETIKKQEYRSNYLSEDKMKLLKQCKTDIYEAIQITPSIKKIIHELITKKISRK